MSDTPITDEAAYDYVTGQPSLDGVVSAYVVRKLERENAALKADKEQTLGILLRWKQVTDEWLGNIESFGYGHAEPDISCGLINDTNAAIDAAREEKEI